MSVEWIDIASRETAIDVVMDLIKFNPSNSKVFDELLSRAKEFNLKDRDAVKFICLMVHIFGGCMFYLPNDESFKRAVTHRLIYKEFKGNNADELSKKYEVSVPAIYRAVKACTKADREMRKIMEGMK